MAELKVLDLQGDQGVAVLALDKGLYPLDVIYGSAYVLIDRAYVLLDKDDEGRTLVRLESRDGGGEDELKELVGEMSNELLSQALRRKITMQNKAELEAIVTQAMAGATGALIPGAIDDDDDLDFLDDPLGIAVPWEEKFSKEARANSAQKASVQTTDEGNAGPGDSGGFQPTPDKGEGS